MIKVLILAKKIHRLFVLFTVLLIVIMSATGTFLKFPTFFSQFSFLDLGLMRYIHNNLSILLTVVLLVMAITGLLLYFIPIILSARKPEITS